MNPRSLILLLLLLLSLPAAAQLPPNEVSLSLGRWDSSELGDAPVFGVTYNRYWARMFSTRLGVFGSREGDFTNAAAHAGVAAHLFRASRISPWVAAGVAQAYARRAGSDDHFVGFEMLLTGIYSGGVDVKVSPRFAVGAEMSYMNYEMMLGDRYGYRADPVMVMVTGRWRY
ncbi:MAG TPA: hypothetical protein VGQ36_08280 [Thermoanaerobaculia bacterium]|jgi:hypothetical protein|nr:hypothetical protein [Thermoanaerobaculia bacterium]